MTWRLTLFLIVMSLALGAALWLRHENSNLRRGFDTANKVASAQKTQITMLKNQLSTASAVSRRQERDQVVLRQQLDAANTLATHRNKTITRLLNENETLRSWWRTALPDVVVRLHTRPAFDNPDDYLQWLSRREQLPDTGEPPDQQRRSE
ncbi:protein lysB [Edwardsiella hoshinae]|uniref:Protein lysB n=1 Tax=Edwardsiella hoshinae TaxID=93378 RepID=A0ABM6EMA5_9GAMM|nr:protein lysB [Edwardsiella hoshinae]